MPTECDKILKILDGRDLNILNNLDQRLNNDKLQIKDERINVQIDDKTSFLITPGDLIEIKKYIKNRINSPQESELSSDSDNDLDKIEEIRKARERDGEKARGRNHSDNGRPPIMPKEKPSAPRNNPSKSSVNLNSTTITFL